MTDFFKNGKASVIVGGQFGSEAKGLAASIIWNRYGPVSAELQAKYIHVTNAGAQAGHTTVLEDGSKFVCYHLPTAGVMNFFGKIYINAGAVVDMDLLRREIQDVSDVTGEGIYLLADRIRVSPFASIIVPEDRVVEGLSTSSATKIGSTRKGVGAAMARKIFREPGAVAQDRYGRFVDMNVAIEPLNLVQLLRQYHTALIEVPQGTGLSLNNGGFYPYCTSRDCWVGQGLTDAGLHPHYIHGTAMVVRTFPIRVGHIYDERGNKIGDSGPFAWGSKELDWERDFPGIEPERTTVTNRVRRIASWSSFQYRQALELNRPDVVILTFCNYLKNADALGKLFEDMYRREAECGLAPEHIFSWGPKASQSSNRITDVIDACWP